MSASNFLGQPRSSRLPRLIRFYDPDDPAPDHLGRTLSSILAWNDNKLEYCHDYIQSLFPLPERSAVNPSAPVISQEIFEAFRRRPELRSRLKESFIRILKFYGFKLSEIETTLKVEPATHFSYASRNWVARFNHNHLRITRIIRSMRVLGLESEAMAFFFALKKVQSASNISSKSLMFWTRAAERPLYIAPEDEEDNGEVIAYLYTYENDKEAAEENRETERIINLHQKHQD